MGIGEDIGNLFGGLFGGFAEGIGDVFMEALKLILVVTVLLILGILALMGKFAIPKPYGTLLALACIIGAIYLIYNGGF